MCSWCRAFRIKTKSLLQGLLHLGVGAGGMRSRSCRWGWNENSFEVVELFLTPCFISSSKKVAGHLYNASEHNGQKWMQLSFARPSTKVNAQLMWKIWLALPKGHLPLCMCVCVSRAAWYKACWISLNAHRRSRQWKALCEGWLFTILSGGEEQTRWECCDHIFTVVGVFFSPPRTAWPSVLCHIPAVKSHLRTRSDGSVGKYALAVPLQAGCCFLD